MVKKTLAEDAVKPLSDFISRNKGSTELKVIWSKESLSAMEEASKASLVDCMKESLKWPILKAKDKVGIDIETSGFPNNGGYESNELDLLNPWVPGYPVSGLFGNVYELKGNDGNVLTVIADFQELGYNFFASPPSYFKCHLSDGTTLRVPYRDIVSHRLKAGFEEHPVTKTRFPDCDEITLDVEPEGPKPSSIGLASPTEDELANFITRCKPNNRSLKSLTLFLRRFESYLAMYERKFKVDRAYRSSCEHENVSNVPKQF